MGGADGVPTQCELSLKFPVRLRCFVFRPLFVECENVSESDKYFAKFRSSTMYRWYANTPPVNCLMKWHGEDEFFKAATEILPKLAEALGPDL